MLLFSSTNCWISITT